MAGTCISPSLKGTAEAMLELGFAPPRASNSFIACGSFGDIMLNLYHTAMGFSVLDISAKYKSTGVCYSLPVSTTSPKKYTLRNNSSLSDTEMFYINISPGFDHIFIQSVLRIG